MKNKLFYLIILLCCYSISYAQDDLSGIKQALNYYLDGTSYNQVETIKKAFYPGAELFLDGKDKELMVVPIEEYAGWFEKKTAGEFNGRIGQILSIERFGNIAMAKVELLIPKAQLQFIDMFILKQIKGEWKIISKTANGKPSEKHGDKVLFVVSNAAFYGDTDLKTGNSFSEIVEAYDTYVRAGFRVDLMSQEGGAVPIAYLNTSSPIQKQYIYDSDFMYAMKHTLTPSEVDAKDYGAIYYVGGGSVLFGVPDNEHIQQIAMDIYESGGVVAAVCHGTAGIVNLKDKNGDYLVAGKTISGFPEAYEKKDLPYFKTFPFLIQETIEQHGGTFKVSPRMTPHVEVSDRVVTGQNHLSTILLTEKVIAILEAKEQHR